MHRNGYVLMDDKGTRSGQPPPLKLAMERIDFIHAEIELALSSLDVAEVTRNEKTRRHKVENARFTRAAVVRLLRANELPYTDQQLVDIRRRLEVLTSRLAGFD